MNVHGKERQNKARLYDAILKLNTPEEAAAFFEDLCTRSEQLAMEQRFDVAVLLHQGKIYHDILEETGVSSATVSRVKRALNYGAGGYTAVLNRMEETSEDG